MVWTEIAATHSMVAKCYTERNFGGKAEILHYMKADVE